ncbi:MAG TPA: ATP-dependent RecD-like DNA helicase [Solirubrobacteraceae bacterium]|jgi:exodeoxyribonuclease V alpha subunit
MSASAAQDALSDYTVEVMSVRYRAPEGDFAVLQGLSEEGEEITLTGALAFLRAGETLQVSGRWREHGRHGRQLQVVQAHVKAPTSELALLSYLEDIKHVGPQGATFLLERHGSEVLNVVDRSPRARLLEVPGIGRARIAAAVSSWQEQSVQREVRMFLASLGVQAAVAARIYRVWGAESIDRLKEDPYGITALPGIGFLTADSLARVLGTPADAPERLHAGLHYTLSQAELDGHCYLPAGELYARASRLLECDVRKHIPSLREVPLLVCEPAESGEELVYDSAMFEIERALASAVRTLLEGQPTLALKRVRRPRQGAFLPTDDQWHAVRVALENRLSILTGGPGTGKTMSMRVLVEILRAEKHSVRLCAPTGKAARRLSAATGEPASTIHRLLEWMPEEGFTRGPDQPIEGADVLIVDEASMLSVRLAEALFSAVGPNTHVLLVGDVDQLAPVGPGRVLEDLIASRRVEVTALQEIFRQAARSLIVRAAHAINRGDSPPLAGDEDTIRDFFFIQCSGAEEIFDEVITLATGRLANYYKLDPTIEIQVLAPMRKGATGIDAINGELRARLNKRGKAVPGTQLRVGDRVIQTRNDHEHELMNGEVGVISEYMPEREKVRLTTDDGRSLTLPTGALDTVQLAYAISIHKSQGSQAPAIVVVLSRAHGNMLTRNLLYTGVTRSEKVCVIVGEPEALKLALSRRDARARYTRLSGLVSS